jgi:hypothetical protein
LGDPFRVSDGSWKADRFLSADDSEESEEPDFLVRASAVRRRAARLFLST